MHISIFIPVHNEEANIGCLLTEIHSCLSGRTTYEIICMDDNPTDNRAGVIAEKAVAITARHKDGWFILLSSGLVDRNTEIGKKLL